MASCPITSWEIDGETVETVADFILEGSKTTADGDCSHEIKRHLLLGRKPMTNLDSILKSRDLTLPTKVCLVKVMVFPVVMYRCELDYKESWAQKNWCFWTMVLEKILASPLDCKEVKPINTDSLEKTPMLGKIEGRRRRRWQRIRIRCLDGITDSMDMSLGKLRELVMDSMLRSMGLQRVGHD